MNYSICLINNRLKNATLAVSHTLRAVCLLLLLGMGSNSLASDFGVAQWGMSYEQVKALETRANLTPFSERSYLIYQVDIANIERARIVYQFQNDQLIQGRFLFSTVNPRNINGFLAHYQYVKSLMTEQYGPANQDLTLTKDGLNKPLTDSELANELASDRLILKSTWASPSANIYHQLTWHQQMPHHQLVYQPIKAPLVSSPTFP